MSMSVGIGGMEIKTKYNEGDLLYIIEKEKYETKCIYCNGLGVVKIKGKNFDCPNCNGKGKTEEELKWDVIDCKVPEKIYIEIEDGIIEVYYVFRWGDCPEYIKEEDCFSNREEAFKECKRRNRNESGRTNKTNRCCCRKDN